MSTEGQLPPPPSVLSRICSESLIAIGVALGILLMWIAQLVGIFGKGGDTPKIMFFLVGLGTAILCSTLISGGILNRNIDKFVRFGMVFIGGFVALAMLAITIMIAL